MQNHCGPALGKVIREGPCREVVFKLRQPGDRGLGRGRGGGNVFYSGRGNSKCQEQRGHLRGCTRKGGSGTRGNRKRGLGHGGPWRSWGESGFYARYGRIPHATEAFKEGVSVVYFLKISLADAWRWIERKQKIEVGSLLEVAQSCGQGRKVVRLSHSRLVDGLEIGAGRKGLVWHKM